MTFADIPAGAAIFLDANVFVYAIVADPQVGSACAALLDRIEQQDLQGFTAAHVLGEVAHRLMTFEAGARFGWPPQGMANRLRRHPNEVQQLILPRRGLDEITASRVQIVPVSGQQVSAAVDVSRQYGLLSADALIVVVMRDSGLSHLASNDADFDRVPGLTRYAPV
jgi:predicted nucleic acid-binding protein